MDFYGKILGENQVRRTGLYSYKSSLSYFLYHRLMASLSPVKIGQAVQEISQNKHRQKRFISTDRHLNFIH